MAKSLFDIDGATQRATHCFDCQHKDEIKLPPYISDGRMYEPHLCHNNLKAICRGAAECEERG